MSAYAKLRRKRQLFVDAFVRTGVGSDAAIAAGFSPKSARIAASKLRANPEVAAAIREREEEAIERAGVRRVRALEELAALALVDLTDLRREDGTVKSFKDIPAALLRGATSIDFNVDGSIKSIRHAKAQGVNMLLTHLKLLSNVVEHQGKDGGPIQTHEVSDLEKARRIAQLLSQGLRAQPVASVLSDPDDEPNSESGA